MTIAVRESSDALTLILNGDIDHAGAEILKTTFNQTNLKGKTVVIFDFKGVNYIGSSGLGKLLLFYKRLSTENVRMRIDSPSTEVRDLLKELKMDTLFNVS